MKLTLEDGTLTWQIGKEHLFEKVTFTFWPKGKPGQKRELPVALGKTILRCGYCCFAY